MRFAEAFSQLCVGGALALYGMSVLGRGFTKIGRHRATITLKGTPAFITGGFALLGSMMLLLSTVVEIIRNDDSPSSWIWVYFIGFIMAMFGMVLGTGIQFAINLPEQMQSFDQRLGKRMNPLYRLVDTWGMYAFYQTPVLLVHPSDLEAILQMLEGWNGYIQFGYLYHCTGVENGYLRLRSESLEFRVKPDNFKPVPTPKFVIGDDVNLKKKPDKFRKVIRLHYHFQNKVVVYHVESSDEIGRTYWFEDQLE